MIEAKIKKSLPGFQLDIAFSAGNETLALFGPSGSGKSMTFQCISGLLRPDEGYININGRVVFDSSKGINLRPQVRKIGYIFQDYALFPHLTVSQNIAFGMSGSNKKEAAAKVQGLIRAMRLDGLEDRYPRQLSGGQQQRVALARALAMEPDILLMDEPFSALDSHVKQELERELLQLREGFQGTILLITHNLEEAYRLSSRIAVYQAGRIVQTGPKEQVIHHPVNKQVASLTGMKNFLEGHIKHIAGDQVLVNTPLGTFSVETPVLPFSVSPGEKVTLGIRPEYISVIDEGENDAAGANTVKAQLRDLWEGLSNRMMEFQPPDSLNPVAFWVADTAKTKDPVLRRGENYSLYFPPGRLTLIRE